MTRLRNNLTGINPSSSNGEIKESHQNKRKKSHTKNRKNVKTMPRPLNEIGNRWIFNMLRFIIIFGSCVYLIIPIVFKLYPSLMVKVIFLNNLVWPPSIDLTVPGDQGLPTTRNFYLATEEHITVGVWHLLPSSMMSQNSDLSPSLFEQSLNSGKPIILYLHGNAGTRGGWHRVQLYKVLRQLDYHVIALDYRGYGDSTGDPSEVGVCHDAKFLYYWIKERSGKSPVLLWGHSLGSGITVRTAKELLEEGSPADGIVLEAPFSTIREAAYYHPFSMFYKFWPCFEDIFVDPIGRNNILFLSEENIGAIISPILIMHAKDDQIIPFWLGEKLYEAAVKTRPIDAPPVEFVKFNASRGYGHKHMHYAPELPEIIINFVNKCIAGHS